MEHAGMVHALEKIQRILVPTGFLIDIHPHPEGAIVSVFQDGEQIFAEPKRDYDGEDVLAAERALADVLGRGLYLKEAHQEFEFVSEAASVAELRECWEAVNAYEAEPKPPEDLAREDALFARADAAARAAGDGATVAMVERASATRLRPAR